MKKLLERVKDFILDPRVAWNEVKTETVEVKDLIVNYAAPLALIPALCNLIGFTIIGIRIPGGVVRGPFVEAFIGGLFGYLIGLAVLLVAGWIVKLLAPMFSAKVDFKLAMKVVVYSMTPIWLVGIFSIIPGLSVLSILGLYGVYLLYLGLQAVLETPKEKTVLYTIAVVVAGFIVSFIASMLVVGLFFGPLYMRMMAV